MKNKTITIVLALGLIATISSCQDGLLNQTSTTEMPTSLFWETESDALTALNGAKANIRYLFNRDYYLDAMGEYVRARGNSFGASTQYGLAYKGLWEILPSGFGTGYDNMFKYCYGGINRTNYVIDGVDKMLLKTTDATSKTNLETIKGEACLLRALVYFRLISMWGDVPYIDERIYSNSEVSSIKRTPIAVVKDFIIADLNYAFEKLPIKATVNGRFSKPAALALRGKVELYWACWNKFGWPELDTFTPNADEATKAYKAAAADFKSVIDDYGLTLYKNGEPGECDELGKADKLPNYYYLFTPLANGDGEFILAFNHGGIGSNQSEEYMRDFAGRSIEGSQVWVAPRFEIADRYQSITTGDFCSPLVKLNPTTVSDARTRLNSSVNPQSYANRDYRMKSTIMWDYEVCKGIMSKKETGWVPFIYKTWGSVVTINGTQYTTYNTDGTNSGYVFRKFVRNYAGQGRSEGDYNWPVIRLADVYLMYAEADNAVNGPQTKAIEVVNKVRHRGNLPQLAADKTSDEGKFFSAIEQERIVELVGEGQRIFDLRRWRAIERVWGAPGSDGIKLYDSWGAQVAFYWANQNQLTYQRCYIYKIPQSERDKNSNLTQNKPYL